MTHDSSQKQNGALIIAEAILNMYKKKVHQYVTVKRLYNCADGSNFQEKFARL